MRGYPSENLKVGGLRGIIFRQFLTCFPARVLLLAFLILYLCISILLPFISSLPLSLRLTPEPSIYHAGNTGGAARQYLHSTTRGFPFH